VRWGILGPLLATDDAGLPIPLPGGRLSVLLAALLTRPNQVVSVDELVDILWDGSPPAGAARTVRVYVVRLRRALGAEAERIITRFPGYLFRADAPDLDLLRFQELCAAAAAAAGDDDWPRSADLLRAAVDLWRGTPLADVPSQLLRDRELPRLDLQHAQAVEDHVDAELRLHRYARLVPRLLELTERFPLREHLHAQLMSALAGAGRRAEALQAYQRARKNLIDELGIEPGPELRDLQRHILADEPAGPETAARARSSVTPRQLPAAVRDFTGRHTELDNLTMLLDGSGVALISAIDGMAGIGKTSLAVQWAHRVAGRFPDGQLYVDLLGYTAAEPMRATDALAMFLRALGMSDAEIPEEPNERAACYRTLLADKRVLVVLDNAWSAEQARPLLPGGASCVALVTSRDSLAGLVARDGAHRVTLDLLSRPEASALLHQLLGSRAAEEPAAIATLVEQCGRLPLALRIAAECAAAHPERSLAELTADLVDHRSRLDLLDAGGDPRTAPRAVFSWSYRHLSPDAARLFRLMGLQPGTALDGAATAELTGDDPTATRLLLDRLVRAHLIHRVGAEYYGMHDLIRDYARELALRHDDEAARQAALTRLFDHYGQTVAAAVEATMPGGRRPTQGISSSPFAAAADAAAWLDAGRTTLLQIVAYTARHGWPRRATALGIDLAIYLSPHGRPADAAVACRHALAAARATGDRSGEAEALMRLGLADWWRGRYPSADEHITRALALFRSAHDEFGETLALANLGLVEEHQGRLAQAAEHFRRAIVLLENAGDKRRMAVVLSNLGALLRQQGDYVAAAEHYRAALEICRAVGDTANMAETLARLGYLALRQRNFADAATDLGQALTLFRQDGDPSGEAHAELMLGEVDTHLGRFPQAHERLGRAVTLAQEAGDRGTEIKALCRLGLTELAEGHLEPADRLLRAALALAREIGEPAREAEALNGLGEVLRRAGDTDRARVHHEAALRVAVRAGHVDEQQRARAGLSDEPG
jgi:DNA-binding SARP family transcriptional activator/Tfp pilus assembly protein PilF